MENKNTYTIKELVAVTGKGAAAVRKAISRANLEPVDVNGQEMVYSVSDLMNVKSIAKFLDADVPATTEPVDAAPETEPETEPENIEAEYEGDAPVEESYEDDTEPDEPDFLGQTLPVDETPVDEDPISDELNADDSFIGQTLPADDDTEYKEPTEQAEYESEGFGGADIEQSEFEPEPEMPEDSENDEVVPVDDYSDEIEPECEESVEQAQYESEPVPVYYPDTEFNNLLTGTSIYTKIVEPFIQLNGIDNISTDFLAAALTQLMFTDTSITDAIAGMHATIDTLQSIAIKLGVVEAPVEDAPVEDVAEEPTVPVEFSLPATFNTEETDETPVEPDVTSEDHSEWLDRDKNDDGTPVLDEMNDTASEDEDISNDDAELADEVELTDEDLDDNIDVELVQKLTEDMQQAQSGIFNPTTSSEYSTIHLSDMPESGSHGLLDSPEPMSANLMRSALMRVQTETETVDDEAANEDSLDESVSFRQSLFAKLGRK